MLANLTSTIVSVVPIVTPQPTNQNDEPAPPGDNDTTGSSTNSGAAGSAGNSTNPAKPQPAAKTATAAAPSAKILDEDIGAAPDEDALRRTAIATQNKLKNDLFLQSFAAQTKIPDVVDTDADDTETSPAVAAYLENGPQKPETERKAA